MLHRKQRIPKRRTENIKWKEMHDIGKAWDKNRRRRIRKRATQKEDKDKRKRRTKLGAVVIWLY
jgi:Spy/CpxP family protein refolding chaperone